MQKPVQFVWVSTSPSGELNWETLTEPVTEKPPPETFARLEGREVYGRLRFENELWILNVFTGDEAAHKKVEESSLDAIAIAQEWMIPPQGPPGT
jgi:hypothetical protein